jgi:hypothetical protein
MRTKFWVILRCKRKNWETEENNIFSTVVNVFHQVLLTCEFAEERVYWRAFDSTEMGLPETILYAKSKEGLDRLSECELHKETL